MKTLAYTLFLSLALGTPNAKANPIHHQLLFEEHADHIVTGTYDEIAIPELLKQYGSIMYNVGPFLINGGYIQWTDLHGQGVNVFGQFGGGTTKTYFFIDSEAQPGVAIYPEGFTVIAGAIDTSDSVPVDVTFFDQASRRAPDLNATGLLLLLPLAAMFGVKAVGRRIAWLRPKAAGLRANS